jgi:hypothetical protein
VRTVTGLPEERAARIAARIVEAQATLLGAVEAIQSGDDWQGFLECQSRLHSYSAGNVLLIHSQHAAAHAEGRVGAPVPTYVAGFNTWRALGRSVERGQRGYVILAPCRYQRRLAVDAEGRTRRLGQDEAPGSDESLREGSVLGGYRVAHVFDVAQTSGRPLPEPPRPKLLEGEAPPGFGASILQLLERRGYRVESVASVREIGGANGLTDWAARRVLVRSDMDDAAMVKTLVHEAAHVLLHLDAPGAQLPRALKEVEAESVAFVVASAHGMSTDGYSFPYVAVWVGAGGVKAVQATQQRVATAARVLIESSPAPHSAGGRVPGCAAALGKVSAAPIAPAVSAVEHARDLGAAL